MDNSVSSRTKIIRNSIVSSIYIDDKIIEPFEDYNESEKSYHELSKGIHNSFKKEQKSLDFYKYNIKKNWRDDSDYLFKNRDLLVLDWQLNETTELVQPETLKILKKAVQTDSLHFVSIYTKAPINQFPQIFYAIKVFFNNSFDETNIAICKKILTDIENEGYDTKFFKDLSTDFRQLALEKDENKEILNRLKTKIQNTLTDKYKIFANSLKEISSDPRKACEVFGYFINEEIFIENVGFEAEVKTDYIAEGFILVNHTIIQITNKSEPAPNEVFQFFTKAIQKVCGNLLTLISLEVRTLLRESSGFIGKDADDIKDAILFHQFEKKHGFLDFLMSIIKSHTLSYFDYRQGKLETVKEDFWKRYGEEKGIKEVVDNLIKEENVHQIIDEILKLNVYYNTLHIKRSKNEFVRFGDIFFSKKDGSYFLCITAHCDCIFPDANIKNNFYFVLGKNENSVELVKKGDDVFCSYVKDQKGILAIKWNPRPVIFKIVNAEIVDGKIIGVDGLDEEYELLYHSTIKENYAQRMANNAFAHAMRVGIDFATLK